MHQGWLELGGRVGPGGEVDYRMTRRAVLRRLANGELDRIDVCDAHPELLRAATSCSEQSRGACPVCAQSSLRIVRYVFGPRLPSGGRCVSTQGELERLAARSGEHRCFSVEVCVACRWNHLQRSFILDAKNVPRVRISKFRPNAVDQRTTTRSTRSASGVGDDEGVAEAVGELIDINDRR